MTPITLRLLGLPLVLSGLLFGGCDSGNETGPVGDDSGTDTGSGDDRDYDDYDNDSIMDIHEGLATDDQDGDGTPNYKDTDADGDFIPQPGG